MFIDNKYVTDVYAKGSQKWPYSGPHGLLWEGLAARLRDRRGALTVEKVPSHAPERLMEGKTPVTGYSANFVADILAGTGAERNQLPPSLLKTIDEVDKEARQVQRHLVGVLEWIGEQAELPKGSIILTKTLDQLKEQYEHQVAEEGEFLTCGLCKQGRHQDLARRWLRGVCRGLSPHSDQWHRSHQMTVYRGVFYCQQCGAWTTTRSKKLVGPCKYPTRGGQQALRDLARGIEPNGLRQGWPLPPSGY